MTKSSEVKFKLFSRGSIGVLAAAFGMLICLEFWLGVTHPFARLPVATTEQGELFTSLASIQREISNDSKKPYAVLMGSSLMVAPVVQAESKYRNQIMKRFSERRSTFCEKQLSEQLNTPSAQNVAIYNAAVGGGMASDDYFIGRALLESKNPPAAIICGVAPRDFQDNLVSGSHTTSAFQVLARPADLVDVFDNDKLTFEQKFDVTLGRVSKIWRNRSELKSYMGLLSKKTIEKICPFILFDKYGDTLVLQPLRRGVFPEEVRGTPMAYPGLAIDHYDEVKTGQQYMRSYNPVDHAAQTEQFIYFERLLSLAEKKGVGVLVVNMPLSKFNKSIMPANFYKDYRTRLQTVCDQKSAEVVDFNTTAWEANSNFIDGVHIRPSQSEKFLTALIERVASSPLSTALHSTDEQSYPVRKIGTKSDNQL